MDLAACDKLHVEGNLQGPLNFSIAFIPLSCSRRDEMGSVSFFFFLLLPLFTAPWPPVRWINDQRCLTVRHSSLLFFFFSSFSNSPPDLQVLEMKRGGNDVHSAPRRCCGWATLLHSFILWMLPTRIFFRRFFFFFFFFYNRIEK